MKTLILAALIVSAATAAGCSDNSPARASSPAASTESERATLATTTTTIDVMERAARLQDVVDTFADSQPVPFGIVVIDLASGARASHLADRVVPSASLYKLFVARELLRRVAAGELSRDAPARESRGRTVGACIHDMIVVSDNACGAAGLRLVGSGALDDELHDQGFASTSLASPQQTTADDIAQFFLRVRTDDEDAELYRLLRTQEINDRLALDLPAGTPIAHKTGDIRHYAHDAGVVTTPNGDVIVSVLSGPWPLPCCDADHPGEAERVAFGAIATLGRAVYDAIA